MEKYTNDLIKESSPYLLQHAHNPVNWVAWSNDVFEQAKNENKMVLISIGYSACHWCHVMEHESFEDEEVATLMNKFFICVKVDREERPDVDQVYMTAVQLMTNRGGWPLNCFTLPDGRPIYGGTYFPKEQWMNILKSLQHTYTNDQEKVQEYAANLHNGIRNHELIASPATGIEFEESKLEELILRWSKSFDKSNGGETRAPKFPLPSNYNFLLDYAIHSNDKKVKDHVELTLNKMAMGGIYDQVGGGFARYSVDMLWKVPHFEKMLYDNGQLISLYSKAYRVFKKPFYKRVVFETIEWLEREMKSDYGAYFSALDADTEGEEGKFYVWKENELKEVLGDDYNWVADLYNINQLGYWEEGNYVLIRNEDEVAFANRHNWSMDAFDERLKLINDKLLSERMRRTRPGVDDKCLTSWNALTISGLCDAYTSFDEEMFKFLAIQCGKWLKDKQLKKDGSLWRNFKEGKSTINAFLDDYAMTIEAFLKLYFATGDTNWLEDVKLINTYVQENFFDEQSGMFYFTESSTELIARKMELNDNVQPASNSIMARNLYCLGTILHDQHYIKQAQQMLANVYDGMEMYGSGYSNWGMLLIHEVYGFYEFVCTGHDNKNIAQELRQSRLPESIIVCEDLHSELSLFDLKESDETCVFVCTLGSCLAPVRTVTDAINTVIQ